MLNLVHVTDTKLSNLYLLSCSSHTKPNFTKTMNKMFFNFIWNNKTDRVKHIYITQDYQDSGFRMVNLENFVLFVKLVWI